MGALVKRKIEGRDVLVDSDTGKAQLRDGSSGEIVEIEPEHLGEVLGGGGYDLAERDDVKHYEQAGKPLQTAAEGVGRGFFQGALAIPKVASKLGSLVVGAEDPMRDITGASTLSDAAGIYDELTGNGTAEQGARVYGEDARGREEANPIAAGAGSLAGQLIGGGGITGVGKAAGGLVAGKVLGAGLGAATEGAIYGGSQATEDANIQDAPLTAGKMLASMGLGAFIGGGLGLTAGAIGKRLSGSSGVADEVAGSLAGKADDAAEAGLGAAEGRAGEYQSGSYSYAGGKAGDSAGKAEGAASSNSAADYLSGKARKAREAGKLSGVADEMADDAANYLGDKVNRFASASEKEKLSGYLTNVRDESIFKAVTDARPSDVVKLQKSYGLSRDAVKEVADVLRNYTDDAGEKLFKTLGKAEDYAPRLRQAVEERGAEIGALRKKVNGIAQLDVDAIVSKIDDAVIAPLKASDDMTERAMAKRLSREMEAFRPKKSDAYRTAVNDNGTRETDYLRLDEFRQKLAKRAGYGSGIKTEAEAAYSQQLRKLERALDGELDTVAQDSLKGSDLTRYKEVQKTYRGLKNARDIAELRTGHNVGMRTFGMSDNQVGQAGAVIGTIMGGGLGGIAAGALGMAGNKLARTYGRGVVASVADRLIQRLDGKVASKVDGFFQNAIPSQAIERIGSAVSGVPNGASGVSRRGAVSAGMHAFMGRESSLPAAYEKRVAEVRQANDNFGQGVREAVSTKLGDMPVTAPKLTMAITNNATRALNYLAAQIPGSAEKPSPLQPGKKLPVSDYEMTKFARIYAAVDNPLTVLDDLERGKVTFEQVDALKAAWPEVYDDIRKHVMERIITQDVKGRPLPYSAKAQLDIFLDLNGAGEPTLTADFGSKINDLRTQQAEAQKQKKQGAPPASPDNRMASGSQALARDWSK